MKLINFVMLQKSADEEIIDSNFMLQNALDKKRTKVSI
jgi:hypothetical protein